MNILFICTHNRCRSILGEAITNHLSNKRIQAFSAGSQPSGVVHPATLQELEKRKISIEGLQSQSFDDFKNAAINLSITVCDSAAGDPCPVWVSDNPQVHWGLADPTKLKGSEEQISAAFEQVIGTISKRINKLLESDIEHMSITDFRVLAASLAELY